MLSETFWVFVLGVIVLFVFFVRHGRALAGPGGRRHGRGADPRGALDRARDVGVAPPRRPRHRRDPRARAARLLARGVQRRVQQRQQALHRVGDRLLHRAHRPARGSSGASYGASTPVKPGSSPARARAYRPFGSRRSHSSSGVSTKTSTNGSPAALVQRARERRGPRANGETSDDDRDRAGVGEQPRDVRRRGATFSGAIGGVEAEVAARARGARCRRRAGTRSGPARRARARPRRRSSTCPTPAARSARPSRRAGPAPPSARRGRAPARASVTSGERSASARRPRAARLDHARRRPCRGVRSSIRMNAPVARLRAYGSASDRRARCAARTRPMSLSSSSSGAARVAQRARRRRARRAPRRVARTRRVVCLSR